MVRTVFLLVAMISSALLPAIVLAHGGTEVAVKGEVRANGLIELEGEEFAPNDSVRVELRKDGAEPIKLGEVAADGDGSFSVSLHVPAVVEPGIYRLAAEGKESAEADVTVLEPLEGGGPLSEEPAESVSNDRPSGETVGLAVMVAAFAAVGAGLLRLSRTRPHPAGPYS